ncbi:hypothetical protein [Dactylosporangium sp. NPDC051541]|uniref:hypothetical protein n=1 Tax=Dactylosporangium sp. NPDC051541 TaxID=3363977 RepID=UPI0037887D46
MAVSPNLLVWTLLRLPVANAIRGPYVIELLKGLLEVLEDKDGTNDAEAYTAFRRTIGMLANLADEGRRR